MLPVALHRRPEGDWVLYTGPAGASEEGLGDGRALLGGWLAAYGQVYGLEPPAELLDQVEERVLQQVRQGDEPEAQKLDWSTYQPYRVPWLRERDGMDHNTALSVASRELKLLLELVDGTPSS